MDTSDKKFRSLINEIIDQSKKQKENQLLKDKFLISTKNLIFVRGIYQPYNTGVIKKMLEQDSFFRLQLDAFWDLYRHIYEIIEKPISQFPLRTLLDICYSRIVYFSQLDKEKQKSHAVKNLLCIIGIILSGKSAEKKWLEDYKILITELNKENDKKRFEKLKKMNFPLREFSEEYGRLWPGLSSEFLWSQIRKDLESILGNKDPLVKEQIGDLTKNLYGYFSILLHGDIISLKNLNEEKKNKRHLFRTYTIFLLTGIQVLKTTDDFLDIQSPKIKDIQQEIQNQSRILVSLKFKNDLF